MYPNYPSQSYPPSYPPQSSQSYSSYPNQQAPNSYPLPPPTASYGSSPYPPSQPPYPAYPPPPPPSTTTTTHPYYNDNQVPYNSSYPAPAPAPPPATNYYSAPPPPPPTPSRYPSNAPPERLNEPVNERGIGTKLLKGAGVLSAATALYKIGKGMGKRKERRHYQRDNALFCPPSVEGNAGMWMGTQEGGYPEDDYYGPDDNGDDGYY